MVDPKELDIEIARLEYAESSYESYAKLAMLYVIRDHNREEDEKQERQEIKATPTSSTIPFDDSSEFLRVASGKDLHRVMGVLDELMDTLRVAYPRVYSRIMGQLENL